MKYAIFAGLSGGFGGAIFQYVDDFDSEDEALDAHMIRLLKSMRVMKVVMV